MTAYRTTGEVNILNGTLTGLIPFRRGVNIIARENSTCKTQLLRALKQGQCKSAEGQPRVLAFSPKRNS